MIGFGIKYTNDEAMCSFSFFSVIYVIRGYVGQLEFMWETYLCLNAGIVGFGMTTFALGTF